MFCSHPRLAAGGCAALLAIATLIGAPTAVAGIALTSVVSANPSNSTPNIVPDGTNGNPKALGIWQVGGTMYVGGSFHAISNAGSTTKLVRTNIAAFSATTGAVSGSFAPSLDGPVWQIRGDAAGLFV